MIRNNILHGTSPSLGLLPDGEETQHHPSRLQNRVGVQTRSFSLLTLQNGSHRRLDLASCHFDSQRRSLFGWGRAKKTAEEPSENVSVTGSTEDVGSETAVDGSQKGGVDETVFSTGTAAKADSSTMNDSLTMDSSPSFAPSFGSSPIQPEDEIVKAATAASEAASSVEGLEWAEAFCWYLPQDHVVNLINYLQQTTGFSYAAVVAGLTCFIRIAVFPIFVKAQQNSARMAHMKPEMDLLKARIDSMGRSADSDAQMKMGLEMRALFKKYDCNPLKAMIVPLVQMPVFVSMFLALRKMPDYFPNELSTGGVLWFPDLAVADPTWALPIASGVLFVAMVELGKEQMLANNRKQGEMMLNIFRAMGVAVTVFTVNFPAVIFCYWMPNNTLSVVQAKLFNNKDVRRKLGIWDLPPPVPGQESKGIMETIQNSMKPSKGQSEAERIKLHNESIDFESRTQGGKKAAAGRHRRKGRRKTN